MHEAGMTDGSRLALVVAFYLTKFDTRALVQLGYATFEEAFGDIGRKMGVNPQSVKNKRDDFDPIFSNARAGWHKRELGPSRMKVMNTFDDLSFDGITGIVQDLIFNPAYRESPEVKDILEILKRKQHPSRRFAPRDATGCMAEELFVEWFREWKTPFCGTIEDKRHDGCGYDSLIRNEDSTQLVEVKGVGNREDGVLFTDKEWRTAQNNFNYALALFVNIHEAPELRIIQNPTALLSPRRTVNLSVRIEWQVTAAQLISKDAHHE